MYLFVNFFCRLILTDHAFRIIWSRASIISESEVSIAVFCLLCSPRYTTVRIKKCLKSTSVLKVATMKKYGQFLVTQRKPSRATTKSTLFTVSKDEWNTKEDTGKSLKNALHVPRYAKRHLSGWSDVEQWKNQAGILSRYQVTLVLKASGS